MKPRCATVQILLLHVCLLVLQTNASTSTEVVHEINFLFIVSFGQSGFNSSAVIPAAEMALEDINNAPNMLPGYKLTFDRVRDSQVRWLEPLIIVLTIANKTVHTVEIFELMPNQASFQCNPPDKYNNRSPLTDITLCLIIVSGTASNKVQVSWVGWKRKYLGWDLS